MPRSLVMPLLMVLLACGDKDDSADAASDGADGAADGADGASDGADGASDGADGASDGADGASDGADGGVEPFSLTIPALTSSAGHPNEAECDGQLPVEYECANASPEVAWSGAPSETVAYVLIFDDPDAGDYDHWAVVNIPADATGLIAGASGDGVTPTMPDGAYELDNGFGWTGYLGSCPPSPHTYRWRMWALPAPLAEGLTSFDEVEAAAASSAIGLAEACHVYGPRADR